MKPFSPSVEKFLLILALFGFVVPNGVFVYYAVAEPRILLGALSNPISVVFISEAFLLMFLFAGLIRYWGFSKPGWLLFVVLSLAGSMAFSVPAYLYLISRNARRKPTGMST